MIEKAGELMVLCGHLKMRIISGACKLIWQNTTLKHRVTSPGHTEIFRENSNRN